MMNLQDYIYYVIVGAVVATIVFCLVRDIYAMVWDALAIACGFLMMSLYKVLQYLGRRLWRFLDIHVFPKLAKLLHLDRETHSFSLSDLSKTISQSFKKK
jgi:hypothetical protein